jgi:hypothetical protein
MPDAELKPQVYREERAKEFFERIRTIHAELALRGHRGPLRHGRTAQ